MARRRYRKRKTNHVQREYKHIAKRRLLDMPSKRSRYHREPYKHKKEVIQYDKREFHPEDSQFPLDTYGRPVHLTLRIKKNFRKDSPNTTAALGFRNPRITPVCKRRSQRRRSLFALGKAGKGIKGPKDRRLTEDSQYKC